MKFSEEYKSAMNEISPDEQTSRRIEQAVLERISVPEKAASAKKKKPFYVYAGAFSGAAACIAVLCVVLINVNGGSLVNSMGGMALAPSGNAGFFEDYTMDASPSSVINETADMISTESTTNKINGYQSAAGSSGLEAPTTPAASDSENRSSQPQDDTAVQEYTITFLPGGAVVLEGDNFHAEFRSNSTVTHFVKPQQDLSRAKTVDGELYRIRLESNYLYIFEDDLQTAECYKLV